MLKLLRKKKVAKRIFYALAILIIPAFVIWGSSSVLSGKDKAPNYAGIISNKKVSYDEFRDAYSAWKTQVRLQYGDKTDEIIHGFMNPVEATWDRLILLQEAKRRNIRISDQEIVARLTSFPFLERNGRFDPATYSLFLKYSLGVSPRVFEEQLRQNLAMARVFDQETKNVKITDEEVRREYEKINVQTRVRYVAFLNAGFKDAAAVSDDEIKAYYEKSKDSLKVPPQINAAYVGIESEGKMSGDEKKSAEERIQKFIATARQKGFEATAKESGLEIKETGLFGAQDSVPGFGWLPQLSEILFDLDARGISKIIQTSHGFYAFFIKEKKDAYLPQMKEAQEKIKEILGTQKAKEIALKKAREFLDLIKTRGMSFDDAVKQAGATVKETPLFSRESYIEELGMAEPLKEAAFKLKKDQVCDDVVTLEQGAYVIQSLDTPVFDEEKFKKEKDDFAQQALAQKRTQAFNVTFEAMRKNAHVASFVTEDMIR